MARDTSWLEWPFFEESHRALEREMAAWAATNIPEDDAADTPAARNIAAGGVCSTLAGKRHTGAGSHRRRGPRSATAEDGTATAPTEGRAAPASGSTAAAGKRGAERSPTGAARPNQQPTTARFFQAAAGNRREPGQARRANERPTSRPRLLDATRASGSGHGRQAARGLTDDRYRYEGAGKSFHGSGARNDCLRTQN